MPENNKDNYREFFEKPLPEIEGLREKLQEQEKIFEKEQPQEKEKLIKKEIEEKLKEFQTSTTSGIPIDDRDEADEIVGFSPEQQVEALVSLVFEKGLEKAVSVAKKINNPAILDQFHDTLVDKYYQMLTSQGVIK